jgi:hypothetical protein
MAPPQYHIGKASKSSRHAVVFFCQELLVVMGLLFTLGTLAQVGACSNLVENTSKMSKDVLLLVHHHSRQ